jgi:hypothetical protein
MATLAFRQHDGGSPYKHLFEEKQWAELIDAFHKENNRINHLTLKSLLTIYLQVSRCSAHHLSAGRPALPYRTHPRMKPRATREGGG